MLATWQEHRGNYIGVKATGDTFIQMLLSLESAA
jgi:hypothetical protein